MLQCYACLMLCPLPTHEHLEQITRRERRGEFPRLACSGGFLCALGEDGVPSGSGGDGHARAQHKLARVHALLREIERHAQAEPAIGRAKAAVVVREEQHASLVQARRDESPEQTDVAPATRDDERAGLWIAENKFGALHSRYNTQGEGTAHKRT